MAHTQRCRGCMRSGCSKRSACVAEYSTLPSFEAAAAVRDACTEPPGEVSLLLLLLCLEALPHPDGSAWVSLTAARACGTAGCPAPCTHIQKHYRVANKATALEITCACTTHTDTLAHTCCTNAHMVQTSAAAHTSSAKLASTRPACSSLRLGMVTNACAHIALLQNGSSSTCW